MRFRSLCLTGACAMFFMVLAAVGSQVFLDWQPCVICVEIRAWLLLAGLLLLTAAVVKPSVVTKVITLLSFVPMSMASWDSYKLFSLEQGWVQSFSCSPFARFPSWLPLHEWMPLFFQPQAICGETVKSILLPLSVWPALVSMIFAVALIIKIKRN
ncbi:disulfide bond formation protein B [Pseudomonas luteola]